MDARGQLFAGTRVNFTIHTQFAISDTFSKLKMPKVRRQNKKPPPEGWELIEPTLEELEGKMREAETEDHEGKRKVEALWPIFKIHHQKSR